MVLVPALIATITPVARNILRTEGVLLVQVPPPVAEPNVVVEPSHNMADPVIAAGDGYTDNV